MTQPDGNLQSWKQDIEKWKTDLTFCRDEVKILNRYLDDVNRDVLSPDMTEDIAHFQARLTETMKKADSMMREVTLYGQDVSLIPFNEENVKAHSFTREKINTFCKSYVALKSAFVKFLAKSEILT